MSSEESWIGATIGDRYTIDKRVARGGMSTVYLAHDERLHRPVAIKVLFPHMAEDRKVVQRFEQEARNSALISHPNVVQVLDQGQTRETAYMVMEYVPGATLRTLLKRGPMTPRLALAYAQAILGGLSAAHRAGLVHRDIKPENVLVSPEGRIKLADFGLARAATHHSGTSTLMGTVAYIAPELLSGEGADERADVYAVGILLYELLTGVQPFTGDTPVRVAFQHVNSTVPAPSAYVPGLAAPLDDLVRSATRAATEQRPKNADEMLEMLESVREQLTAEELDFDGALLQHRRHHAEAAEHDHSPNASTHVLAAVPPDTDSSGTEPAAEEEQDEPEATTVAMGGEDFPTAVEDRNSWDDDVTAALGHSASADPPPAPRPQAREGAGPRQASEREQWGSLAVEDRQTVAEVPLQLGRLSVQEPQTGLHPLTPERPRRTYDPRADKRQRQRPLEQLNGPSHVRQAVAFVIVLMLMAVLMLLGYQLGISNRFVPSLGG
ncbi:protein kinase domain-containing protein [Nesterenkonia natronophila]|uniref:non-specific serine/threonine protein kinase n=1 Tax=Nesterenkonia natronophila TaxID=2174932 RepID=A0A3A4FKU9_9MICC|nr:protein kinase [Nesterenkonia natronophila]RJN33075.1 serine/threonine protein kinase [Nesterenkonia natronophila]